MNEKALKLSRKFKHKYRFEYERMGRAEYEPDS
ncbi:MAG: hypothetical protein ACI8UR_002512 [Natronomonas sp.]|jgi:hypothetical protein